MPKNTIEQSQYYLTTYAQNREDLYIQALFSQNYKGFYIDVGSNHPIHYSATKLLYRSGWHGINIDPNRTLMELTDYDRQRDVQLRCGVGSKRGKLTFRQYHNDGLSTFSKVAQEEYAGQKSEFTYTDREVDVRTLKDICDEHKVATIDLLKIDVEEFEEDILRGNDWQKYRPKVICIKTIRKNSDWKGIIEAQRYVKKTTDGLNDYYVDASSDLVDAPFRYAETTLAYPHIVDNDVAGYIAVQSIRSEVREVIYRAKRPTERKASIPLLKERVHKSLEELKYLVKESNKPPHVGYVPSHVIQAPNDMAKLSNYIQKVQNVYAQSFADMRQYELAQLPKSKASGVVRRMKLAGYDTPRLVLSEAGKVVRKRMK